MKTKFYFLILLCLPCFATAQTEHLVQPNIADPLSGAPNNFHFAYINKTVTQKNKLFLFFPGTGAVPFNYKLIIQHAANLGYHAIGLTYPNADAINSICQSSTDTTCHSRARLEVFDGVDRHSGLSVDTNNCIERRTLRLLQYLNTAFPTENWGQYFSGNDILWNKIIVSGHSQGGGHAGIISKVKRVDRVVMFAATDWINQLNRNADWITWNGITTADRYYGFTHQKDEYVNFNVIQTTWLNYGMDFYAPLAFVDSLNVPYNNSQMLYTLRKPAVDSTQFHGSVVADAYTPLHLGAPVFAPVWTYMIEGNEMSINKVNALGYLNLFPNPSSSGLNLNCENCKDYVYTIYDLQGQVLMQGKLAQNNLDVSSLNNGVYILNISFENSSKALVFVKE